MSKASLQQLGACLVELSLIHRRDHTQYSYYGDSSHPDPLFETAAPWDLDVEADQGQRDGANQTKAQGESNDRLA